MKQIFLIFPPSIGELFILACVLIVLSVPAVPYILTLQNTLKAIRPQNRKMKPTDVWLLLIPLFNLVWHFIVVTHITNSINVEYRSRNLSLNSQTSYGVGMTLCILCCLCLIPFLPILAFIPALICWIIFWVQIHGHKNRIIALSYSSPPSTQYHS